MLGWGQTKLAPVIIRPTIIRRFLQNAEHKYFFVMKPTALRTIWRVQMKFTPIRFMKWIHKPTPSTTIHRFEAILEVCNAHRHLYVDSHNALFTWKQ